MKKFRLHREILLFGRKIRGGKIGINVEIVLSWEEGKKGKCASGFYIQEGYGTQFIMVEKEGKRKKAAKSIGLGYLSRMPPRPRAAKKRRNECGFYFN